MRIRSIALGESMKCPVCSRRQYKPHGTVRVPPASALARYLRGVNGQTCGVLRLVRCVECGCVHQCPVFERSVYLGWYRTEHYEFERGIGYASNGCESLNHATRVFDRLNSSLRLRPGRVLDAGCGRGAFLSVCQRHGWRVDGCDVSPIYASAARSLLGVPVDTTPYEELGERLGRFDLITFWDVFEHFVNPERTLEQTARLLNKNGVIAIEVPNVRSLFARILRGHWWFGFEHIFYYTARGLTSLLARCGFDPLVVETDNINLLSREGLARLGFFGPDAVWGRTTSRHPNGFAGSLQSTTGHREWSGVLSEVPPQDDPINAPINRLLNRCLLGDQLRVFARLRR